MMTAGYVYALLGLLSFGALGILHKMGDTWKCAPSAVNALLYAWSCVFLVVGMVAGHVAFAAPAAVSTIALPFGVSASVAILAFQAGIRHGDIATSWLAINLSSGVPTVASILIYHEALDWKRTVALCLIPISMALLWKDKREAEKLRG
jgi:EamA domain-containing membrane protein RarD